MNWETAGLVNVPEDVSYIVRIVQLSGDGAKALVVAWVEHGEVRCVHQEFVEVTPESSFTVRSMLIKSFEALAEQIREV